MSAISSPPVSSLPLYSRQVFSNILSSAPLPKIRNTVAEQNDSSRDEENIKHNNAHKQEDHRLTEIWYEDFLRLKREEADTLRRPTMSSNPLPKIRNTVAEQEEADPPCQVTHCHNPETSKKNSS